MHRGERRESNCLLKFAYSHASQVVNQPAFESKNGSWARLNHSVRRHLSPNAARESLRRHQLLGTR